MCQTKLFASILLALFFVGFSRAEPQCERINKIIPDLHLQCGYNYTSRFNYDHHFNSASRGIVSLKSVLKNCSAFVDIMICSLFLPRCTEEIKGPYLPCRGVCYDYANECSEVIKRRGLEWTVAMCDILPEKDNPQTTQGYRERCFTPPNYKDSGKRYQHNCSDIVISECQGIPGFTKTVVSPKMQHSYASYITSKIRYNTSEPCRTKRKEIVCAENLPGCINGTAAFYCRDKCLSFFNTCKSPFFYGSDMCMEFPERNYHKLPLCKQNHWPRAENWQLPGKPTPSTGTSGISPSQGPTIKIGVVSTDGKKPTTDTIPSTGLRKQQKDKKSGSSKLLIGLVVAFVFVILIAIGVIGFVWYRRKKTHQFDYQKQVLYSEDRADEFEI